MLRSSVPSIPILALLVSLITALPVGIYSAIRQDTIGDYGGRTVAITEP